MFKKPIKVKTQNILKGSERKKLRELVARSFPNAKEEDILSLIPTKEEVSVLKIAQSRMLIYLLGKEPILFDPNDDNDIYPTAFTLHKIPNILPTLTIFPPVLHYILKGANLMLPGVADDNIGVCQIGDKRSVVLMGTSFPIAVGTMAIASRTGIIERKGIALSVIHHFRDTLSEMGTRIDITIPDISEDDKLATEFSEGVDIIDSESTITATETTTTTTTTTTETTDINNNNSESSSSTPPGDKSMDELLLASFLQAIRTKLKDKKLPILINVFYATMMIPCRPVGTELEIKKSSYKKLSVFLYAMKVLVGEGDPLGLISLVEESPGVIYITAVHRGNEIYRRFQPHISVQDEEDREAEKTKPKGDGKIKIKEIFELPPSLHRIIESDSNIQCIQGPKKEVLFTTTDIAEILWTYVRINSLDQPLLEEKSFPSLSSSTTTTPSKQQTSSKRAPSKATPSEPTPSKEQPPSKPASTVRVDSFLAANLYKGKVSEGTEVQKQDILMAFKEKLRPFYQIVRENGDVDVKKGKVQMIQISSAKVSNKWVTSITNLAGLCSIDFSVVTRDLQHKFACSTSTTKDVSGVCDKILVHGNFVKEVAEYLVEKYHVPKRSYSS
eukprot:TRINITY_DN7131_c0_g1_i1.p1 TRINITY_DN7131_c0_g1~~TRINITY_DN7131_c0_g1_i1.p1  ORF type:complete len:615 (-),score=137.22 TRINITY_DN7131_c0_g1_i1:87-1931(-)